MHKQKRDPIPRRQTHQLGVSGGEIARRGDRSEGVLEGYHLRDLEGASPARGKGVFAAEGTFLCFFSTSAIRLSKESRYPG